MICPKCKFQWVSTQRSSKQNKYLHGVLFSMIAEEMGEDNIEYVKALMKEKFLTTEEAIYTKQGKKLEEKKVRGTHELDTKEMVEFIDKCRRWALNYLNINIPEPTNEKESQETKATHNLGE